MRLTHYYPVPSQPPVPAAIRTLPPHERVIALRRLLQARFPGVRFGFARDGTMHKRSAARSGRRVSVSAASHP